MELRTYFAIFWRRKWIMLLFSVVTVMGTGVVTYLATPVYLSATTLRVATVGSSTDSGRTDIGYTERLMNTYSRIVTGATVRDAIKQQLGLAARPQLTVESIPNTELMKLNAEASTPLVAQQIATAAANLLIDQSRELYNGNGQTTQEILQRQIEQAESELATSRNEYDQLAAAPTPDKSRLEAASQAIEVKERTYTTLLDQYERVRLRDALLANTVSVVEPAYLPEAPTKPRRALNLVLAVLVGVIGGMGVALLIDNLDTTLYTVRQIEAATQLPTIGKIPTMVAPLAVVDLPSGAGAQPALEAFRRLRVNLLPPIQQEHGQALLVTSAVPGEGKSTIVANLATTIARSGRRVAVMDCDLYLPTLHKVFKLSNECGLTSILLKQASVAGALQKSDLPNLFLLSSGPPLLTSHPTAGLRKIMPKTFATHLDQGTELLGLADMKEIIAELKAQFDVVLLDTPALLCVTDAAVMAPLVDQVLLVVACAQSQRGDLRAANEQLETVRRDAIRVVVNRTERLRTYAKYSNIRRRTNGR